MGGCGGGVRWGWGGEVGGGGAELGRNSEQAADSPAQPARPGTQAPARHAGAGPARHSRPGRVVVWRPGCLTCAGARRGQARVSGARRPALFPRLRVPPPPMRPRRDEHDGTEVISVPVTWGDVSAGRRRASRRAGPAGWLWRCSGGSTVCRGARGRRGRSECPAAGARRRPCGGREALRATLWKW